MLLEEMMLLTEMGFKEFTPNEVATCCYCRPKYLTLVLQPPLKPDCPSDPLHCALAVHFIIKLVVRGCMEMPPLRGRLFPLKVTFGAAMSSCARAGEWRQCLALLGEMRLRGLAPTRPCLDTAIDALETAREVRLARLCCPCTPREEQAAGAGDFVEVGEETGATPILFFARRPRRTARLRSR